MVAPTCVEPHVSEHRAQGEQTRPVPGRRLPDQGRIWCSQAPRLDFGDRVFPAVPGPPACHPLSARRKDSSISVTPAQEGQVSCLWQGTSPTSGCGGGAVHKPFPSMTLKRARGRVLWQFGTFVLLANMAYFLTSLLFSFPPL
jgi:hypothetical protein